MKFKTYILILLVLFLNFQFAAGGENDYGIVKAWFNGKNATVTDVQLRIGEPVEVKVEIISKINGDVILKLYEPGVSRAFEVINGPSVIEKRIDNMNVESGWSKTYTWTVAPSGAWKNGNAPINLFVQFYKGMNDKKIDFTIANPYILDEQYSGAISKPKTTSTSTGTSKSTPAKETPFIPAIFTIIVLLLAWRWRRGNS
jgi:sarcinarray family protein